ncbi:MAG: MlaE family ABC transporter permease [Planctomycetota bacterium]|jgi:phospholipid/cholesterol/gamma-HCH transport system permease protein
MTELLARVGRGGLAIGGFLLECGKLLRGFLYWTTIATFRGYPIRMREAARQSVRVGVRSIPIVFLVNFFVGATLAFTVAEILDLFGANSFTGAVMGVGFWRELAPLLTGIIMSGYVGASLAAEIGTMKVGEEIMALEAAALNPIRFLVVPRLLAVLLMVPVVTLMGVVFGIYGGYVVCVGVLDQSTQLYWDQMIQYVENVDVKLGMLKAFVFAIIVGTTGMAQGFRVKGGAEGVGAATTNAVVYSIIFIILADCIVTAVHYFG